MIEGLHAAVAAWCSARDRHAALEQRVAAAEAELADAQAEVVKVRKTVVAALARGEEAPPDAAKQRAAAQDAAEQLALLKDALTVSSANVARVYLGVTQALGNEERRKHSADVREAAEAKLAFEHARTRNERAIAALDENRRRGNVPIERLYPEELQEALRAVQGKAG